MNDFTAFLVGILIIILVVCAINVLKKDNNFRTGNDCFEMCETQKCLDNCFDMVEDQYYPW